jgi:hypothetical protein
MVERAPIVWRIFEIARKAVGEERESGSRGVGRVENEPK